MLEFMAARMLNGMAFHDFDHEAHSPRAIRKVCHAKTCYGRD